MGAGADATAGIGAALREATCALAGLSEPVGVEGITVNEDICRHYVEYSIGTVTALNPVIGYDRATELAKEAMASGRGILELVREKTLLTEKQIAEILDPAAMTGQARPV